MFKPNTVLIVGAGASAEVGLPIGTGLVDHIAGLVTIERDELTGRLPEHKPGMGCQAAIEALSSKSALGRGLGAIRLGSKSRA
jgi:hypothetical protein